jgi:hypothetical protein
MEKEKTGCKKCKSRSELKTSEIVMFVLGLYMCFAGIYGTIQLIKNFILN